MGAFDKDKTNNGLKLYREVFTSSGIFKPSGKLLSLGGTVRVSMCGGGGGGASGAGGGDTYGGGGGGSGGNGCYLTSLVIVKGNTTVTIGSGGSAQTSVGAYPAGSGFSGYGGSSTMFGLIAVNGGGGGGSPSSILAGIAGVSTPIHNTSPWNSITTYSGGLGYGGNDGQEGSPGAGGLKNTRLYFGGNYGQGGNGGNGGSLYSDGYAGSAGTTGICIVEWWE